MTLLSEVQELREEVQTLKGELTDVRKQVNRHEEQVNGRTGLFAAMNVLTEEVRSLRKAAYWVAGIIIVSSIGFAFGVLLLIPT